MRSLKPCSTGARAADRAWFACRWAGVVLLVRVDLYSGDDDRVVRVGV